MPNPKITERTQADRRASFQPAEVVVVAPASWPAALATVGIE